jgi:hypothetical protein
MSPAGIAERGKVYAKKVFTRPDGELRIERIIGSVVGALASLKIIRKIF